MIQALRRSLLLAVTAAFCAVTPMRPATAATNAEVDAAIKKAKAYIYSQQKGDNWELVAAMPPADKRPQYRVEGWQWGGVTGTAIYGLLASGESTQDPKIKASLEWLKKADIHGHYAAAMRAQAWPFIKDEREAAQASRADFKIFLNGLIGDKKPMGERGSPFGFYGYYTDEKGKIQPNWYDRSVSQLCVLGMWACEQAGQEIPSEYWRVVDAAWKGAQRPDGGWNYQDNREGGSTGTMTAAGIATLFITQDFILQADGSQWSTCRGGQRNPWIDKGLDWMDKNAPKLLQSAPHYHYQLYGIERIGVASGRKYFGTTDWYKVGADKLVEMQNKDGSWGKDDAGHNPKKIPDTVFSILFLVRGRAPVIMNKLEYTSVPDPASKIPAMPDPWNQRPRDAANFAHWSGKQIEQYLNWQVVNLKVPAHELHDAPILYIAGSLPLKFKEDEIKKLREFVEGGGLILGNADCANANFTKSFIDLGGELFPKYEFRELPKTHPIYTEEQFRPTKWKVQPKVMGLTNGVRELMVLIPDADIARFWQTRSEKTKNECYELMQNIFLYSIDKSGLYSRDSSYIVLKDGKIKPEKSMEVARVIVGDNPNPEPGAWRRMSAIMHNQAKLDLKLETVKLGEGKLGPQKVAHLTGTAKFTLNEKQRAELKSYVEKGGTLLIDAAGGSNDFATAAETELAAMFGGEVGSFGTILPPDHPVYTPGNSKIAQFTYRAFVRGKVAGSLNAPRIRAHVIQGRPAVLYSREDLTAGMIGNEVDGIIGYSPATATQIVKQVLTYVAYKGGGAPVAATSADTKAPAAPAAKPRPRSPTPRPRPSRRRRSRRFVSQLRGFG
ncbi:DUF4159 domain-containing protein [Humisphaera borealis]|nr:DUF4159 domain-containing protein [Humisphaera borealis]